MNARPTLFVGLSGLLAAALTVPPVSADVPSTTNSYYVPQAGPVATPLEGEAAITYFHTCPNNDGVTSLPNSARIKVVVRNAAGFGIAGVAAQDILILLNGGTPAQGFSGLGADSMIANSQFNPMCPDLRFVTADAPTDLNGTTYITFRGADPSSPGVGIRSPARKWGHYDSELPVYVVGFKFHGRLTSASANDTYTLRIKNVDWTGGLDVSSVGEAVTLSDFNGVANGIGVNNALSYWKDFDSQNGVTASDLNLIATHLNHNCATPINP
jgi:hypothetical protein